MMISPSLVKTPIREATLREQEDTSPVARSSFSGGMPKISHHLENKRSSYYLQRGSGSSGLASRIHLKRYYKYFYADRIF